MFSAETCSIRQRPGQAYRLQSLLPRKLTDDWPQQKYILLQLVVLDLCCPTLILCLSSSCFVLSDKPRKLTAVLGCPGGLIDPRKHSWSYRSLQRGEASRIVSSVHLHDGVINNFRPLVNTVSRGVIDVFWSKLSSAGKVLMITSEYIRSEDKCSKVWGTHNGSGWGICYLLCMANINGESLAQLGPGNILTQLHRATGLFSLNAGFLQICVRYEGGISRQWRCMGLGGCFQVKIFSTSGITRLLKRKGGMFHDVMAAVITTYNNALIAPLLSKVCTH